MNRITLVILILVNTLFANTLNKGDLKGLKELDMEPCFISNKILQDTFYEYTNVSEFFNELHFGENIPVIGQFLMGLASIGVLFLIFSAILLFLFNKIFLYNSCINFLIFFI